MEGSNKWFWAWRALKMKEREELKYIGKDDMAFISALLSSICCAKIPKGDGKFSRIANYVHGIREEIEWCRKNWKGDDEVLTAFFMGVEAMVSELERTVEAVKKG